MAETEARLVSDPGTKREKQIDDNLFLSVDLLL